MVEEPSYTCSQCGGPNPAFSRNCQWCGASIEPPPLPSSGPAPPLPLEEAPLYPDVNKFELGEPEGVPGWVRGVIALVVFVVFIVVIFSYSASTPPVPSSTPLPSGPAYPVNITTIELTSSDNVCGLNGTGEPGFQGVTNAVSGETWQISGPPGGCSINGISSETGGITALTLDLPTSISAGQVASISVSFVMNGLGGSYTGPLVISVT